MLHDGGGPNDGCAVYANHLVHQDAVARRVASTRVVRISVSARRRIDEPDDVATGSQDEKIQGCVEPMGEEGTVGIGGERVAGDFGAAVPPLPGPLRGRGTCWPG